MYLPPHFQENDQAEIFRFMRANAFATLITVTDGIPFANHIPLLLEQGENPKLLGHLAKANPQWQQFAESPRVLVIFQGAHTYISPTWYEKPGVPTWNYTAVHVYGNIRLIRDTEQLRDMVNRLSAQYEGTDTNAWTPTYADKLLEAIVGFEIEVDAIQAKYKLSQNRSEADQQNVVNALQVSGAENDRAVAALMQQRHQHRPTTFNLPAK